MRVQCDVCERAEAEVLCCADEAALCVGCDREIHEANKVASKHPRIPLTKSSPECSPQCDICQEKIGFLFCLQDRALLCRNCDDSIHSASTLMRSHCRLVITGTMVNAKEVEASFKDFIPPWDSDYSKVRSEGAYNWSCVRPALEHQGMPRTPTKSGVSKPSCIKGKLKIVPVFDSDDDAFVPDLDLQFI